MKRLLAVVAILFWSSAAQAGLILEGSTDSLEVITSAAGSVDYQASWANVTATALTTPGTTKGNITTATTTTVIAAPAASNFRHVRALYLRNASTSASNTVTVQVDVSATNRVLHSATLAPGETLVLKETGEFSVYASSGLERTMPFENVGFKGLSFTISKVATAFDTIGYHYNYAKDAGLPGAFGLQAPGLNGFNTDCSLASQATNPNGATQMGSYVLPDPTGAWYLTEFGLTGTVAGSFQLVDVLWYNTGIVVTTTTAQNITMPGALPARDLNGSTNGAGVMAALLTTTANTNAAAIANTTISYTDQDGNAGNTGTFTALAGFQAPVSPVIGTWMPFQLAAGDTGIRSVQSITLGTSYVAGALSLILYRPLAQEGVTTANFPSGSLVGQNATGENPGIRVYNDTCFWLNAIGAPATTANPVYGGVIRLMDR